MVRRGPHVPKEPPKPPTEEEILAESLSTEATSLEEEALRVLKPEQVRVLKKIAYYVGSVGMDLEEACTMLDISHEQFKIDMETTPIVKKIITIKMLQFKKDLMATLAARARSGDDKLALELLARRYPNEFGEQKKKNPDDPGRDLLQEAIIFIRQGRNHAAPLVSETSGRAVVITQKTSQGPIERIGDILGAAVQIVPEPTPVPSRTLP